MFKWLGGGAKVDHPMADEKRAGEIADSIAASDTVKALDEAVYWLDSINQTAEFKVEARFDAIERIELAARKFRQRVMDDYFAALGQSKFQENRLHAAASNYWKTLADAYLRCASQLAAEKGGPASFKSRAPLISVRGLRALAQQVKWVQFRYGKIDVQLWKNVAILFKLAESGGSAEQRVEIFPGAKPATSARNEFLRLMMLWAAAPASLSPLKQDVTEWVAGFLADKFILQNRPEAEHVFMFDLGNAQQPRRWSSEMPVNPSACYFDAGEAVQAVQSLADTVASMGALPSGVDLGPHKNSDIVVDVLRHLARSWARALPVRVAEWRKTALTLSIVHGFEEVMGVVAPAQSAGLDFTDEPASATWIAENASLGGYGAVVPAGKDDWLQVGVLLGIKSERDKAWGVGVVRRIETDDYGQRRAGIQLLSRTPLPIELRSSDASDKTHRALLLDSEPAADGHMDVLVPQNVFTLREDILGVYRKDAAKQCTLKPAGVLQTGTDFIWARFMAEFDLL